MQRAIAYIRVSSEEQARDDRWSIPAQRREIAQYCAARGWTLVDEYTDEVSARTDSIVKRPGLRALLEAVRQRSLGADVVVVHEMSRWARNVLVTLQTLALLGENNVAPVSIKEQVDYSDPMGRVFLTMIAAFAQLFSDQLSQHSKKGKRERALQGYYNGYPPYGYINPQPGRAGEHNKTVPVLVDEEIAWYIKARDWYRPSTGGSTPEGEAASFHEVARRLNEGGSRVRNRWSGKERWKNRNPHRLWTADTVAHMLQSKFYCGLVAYKGEWIEGQHQAVSTLDMIEEIRTKARANGLGRPAAAPPSGRIYLLNRRLFCQACGEPLRVQPEGDKIRFVCTARSRGLLCSARRRSIGQDALERQIAGLIAAVHLPPAYRDRALALIGELDPQSEEAQIHTRRSALQAELARCKHAFKVGASDQAEFDADVRRIQRELESLPPVTTLEERKLTMDEAATYLDNVRELWAIATRSEQRTMAQTLFRAVHVDLDAGAIVKADLPPRYRDLLPFIGTAGEETMRATGTHECVPVAQSARQANNPVLGRNRRDSGTPWEYNTGPVCSRD
jgi:DNA invertase Pin-like site-specific DNA recombinase